MYHAKVDFARWPISHEVYQGVDYTRGVDLSWWKNHPTPVSFFAWNFDGDFFGGYDHGKEAGIICVQDHNVSPGAKFFEWGNGPEGKLWDKVLDSQGDYLELMSGNFSDNQPDYSWIQPSETKIATAYWFPIRGIGGAKNANLNGAVNLEVGPGRKVKIGFSTTQEFRGAKAVLTAGNRTLFERSIDISPAKAFVQEITLPDGVGEDDLKADLLDSANKELLSYQPVKHVPESTPPVVEPPLPPKEIKTVDELYLIGLRLEQFHNAALAPYAYFEEALSRDPGDYEVNTALGRLYSERGLWRQARERLTQLSPGPLAITRGPKMAKPITTWASHCEAKAGIAKRRTRSTAPRGAKRGRPRATNSLLNWTDSGVTGRKRSRILTIRWPTTRSTAGPGI